MPTALLIGDVHATPEELGDCQKLIDYVVEVAAQHEVDKVVFMGDLFHSHSVVRVEVLAFWRRAFERMEAAGLAVYALVGNHDFAGEGLADHALLAHEDQIGVIAEPSELFPGVLMLPYVADKEVFETLCNDNACATVLCHQTFEGAQFDNGMYAPGGTNPNLIPQMNVISGHIHKPAVFSKVTYIGAPRWRTLSDADVNRSIVMFEFAPGTGAVVSRKDFSTNDVCRRICFREVTPESTLDASDLTPNVDWRIDVKGPAEFIDKMKATLAGPGVRLRTFKTDTKTFKLKESEGIENTFAKFMESYTPRYGTKKARLQELATERLR